jgi:predicted alpha/beta-hydrolase family hydrolase
MSEQRLEIAVPNKGTVTALLSPPAGAGPMRLFVYAPGAGAGLDDPFGISLAQQLPGRGVGVLRFQFPYREQGRSSLPDPTAVLEATWEAVVDKARALHPSPVIGGRSMGGRIASEAVAKGLAVKALVLFAYPLHPPGRPETRRDAHLTRIDVPTLFCSGTRDVFASPPELETVVAKMPRASVHLLDGADHSFAVLKASGRTRESVWREALDAMIAFLGRSG